MPTDIIIAVFASSGFWAFIQYLMNRNDGTKAELRQISADVKELSDRVDENAAILARTHILRFSDELLNGIEHSQSYFRQQMDDIDTYEEYCDHHDGFRNSYTTIAAEHIKETYKKLLAEGEFRKEQ